MDINQLEKYIQGMNNDLNINMNIVYDIGTRIFLDNINKLPNFIDKQSKFNNALKIHYIHNKKITGRIFKSGKIQLIGIKDVNMFKECAATLSKDLSLYVDKLDKINIHNIILHQIITFPKTKSSFHINKLHLCKLLIEEQNPNINIKVPLNDKYVDTKFRYCESINVNIKYKKLSDIALFNSGNYIIRSNNIDLINESYLFIKNRLQLYSEKINIDSESNNNINKDELINFLSKTYNVDKELINI